MRVVTTTFVLSLCVIGAYAAFTLYMRNWVRAQEAKIAESARVYRMQSHREDASKEEKFFKDLELEMSKWRHPAGKGRQQQI